MFRGEIFSGMFDLKDTFNNGDITREGNNFEEILAGMTMQPSESYDTNFVEDVSNHFCFFFFDKRVKGVRNDKPESNK